MARHRKPWRTVLMQRRIASISAYVRRAQPRAYRRTRCITMLALWPFRRALAVLSSGPDQVYPERNRALADAIMARCALISESRRRGFLNPHYRPAHSSNHC